MKFEDFLQATEPPSENEEGEVAAVTEDLEVQKAVVESLAADKAAQDEELARLRNELSEKNREIAVKDGQISAMSANNASLHSEIESLKGKVSDLSSRLDAELERQIDLQSRNPNALALLDRDVELPDRFPGETRDHVLEAIADARNRAEADGRARCAQVLEGVLLSNEPNGSLAKLRAELVKLFDDNCNIINGTVINELIKRGISHKNGENYLLPSEIIKRTY